MHRYSKKNMRDMQKAMQKAYDYFKRFQIGLTGKAATEMITHLMDVKNAGVIFESIADGHAEATAD